MKIPLVKPFINAEEASAVSETVRSTWINEGAKVREFESGIAKYVGSRHAIAFFNGTVGLHAALLESGIGAGDEVIVPSFTFFSTASSVVHTGAVPVFADISEVGLGLDANAIFERITPRTKAIIVVHYAGCPADWSQLLSWRTAED